MLTVSTISTLGIHIACFNASIRSCDDAPQAVIRVRDGKKFVHKGIKVEFIGTIGTLDIPRNERTISC